jgi:hypothetical protein
MKTNCKLTIVRVTNGFLLRADTPEHWAAAEMATVFESLAGVHAFLDVHFSDPEVPADAAARADKAAEADRALAAKAATDVDSAMRLMARHTVTALEHPAERRAVSRGDSVMLDALRTVIAAPDLNSTPRPAMPGDVLCHAVIVPARIDLASGGIVTNVSPAIGGVTGIKSADMFGSKPLPRPVFPSNPYSPNE